MKHMKDSLMHKKHLTGFFFLTCVHKEETWGEKLASSEETAEVLPVAAKAGHFWVHKDDLRVGATLL